jgi:hypothetical protein
MIAYFDIEQLSDKWHLMKHGKIGGSLAKGLYVKTDTLMYEIGAQLTEDYDFSNEEDYQSSAMQRGMDLQPQAIMELNKYTGLNFIECGWLQSEKIPIIGISPDGITEDLLYSCEIKCPGAKRHFETIANNEIPLDNLDQCIHYFTVNQKLVKHFFMSYRPESKLKKIFVKELTRESIVNIGTKSKPKIISINDASIIARSEAERIHKDINQLIENLKF